MRPETTGLREPLDFFLHHRRGGCTGRAYENEDGSSA